jgi:hypothetical protein
MYRLLTIILCFFLLGCVDKIDYANSPNFNVQKKRFQHPAGDPSDKTVADLFKMMKAFSNRATDQSEKHGFPVTYSDQATLSAFFRSRITDWICWTQESYPSSI